MKDHVAEWEISIFLEDRPEKTPLLSLSCTLYHPEVAEGGSRLLATFNISGLVIRPLTPLSLLYRDGVYPLDFMLILFFLLFTVSWVLAPLPKREISSLLSHYIPNKLNSSSHVSKTEWRESFSDGLSAFTHVEFIFSDLGWPNLSCHIPDKRTLGLCIMALISPYLFGDFFALYILGYHLTFSWTKLFGDSQSSFDQLVHPDVSPPWHLQRMCSQFQHM